MLNPDRATEILQSWESAFTNLSHHNPNTYRYLIHGVSDRFIAQYLRMSAGYYYPSPEHDLIEHPENINKRKILACSVIDQAHPWLFSPLGGYIIKSPFNNILGAFPEDIGSLLYKDTDFFIADRGPLNTTVEELMNQTPTNSYNEVVLTGSTEDGKLQISGIFLTHIKKLGPNQKEVVKKLRKNAHSLQLPIIFFSNPRYDWVSI